MTIPSGYAPLHSSTTGITPQRAVSQVPHETTEPGTNMPKFKWAQGVARATLRVVSAPIALVKAMASKVLNLLYGRSDATAPRARPYISTPFFASPPSPSIKLFTPDPESRWRPGVPEGMSQNRPSSATVSTVVSDPPSPSASTPVDSTIRWRPGALEGMSQSRPPSATVSTVISERPSPPPRKPVEPTIRWRPGALESMSQSRPPSATVSTVVSERPSPPPRKPVEPTIRWRPGVSTPSTPTAAAGSKPESLIATPAERRRAMAWRSEVLEDLAQTRPVTAASRREAMSPPMSTKLAESAIEGDGKAPERVDVRLSIDQHFEYILEETTTVSKRILRPKDEAPPDPGPTVS